MKETQCKVQCQVQQNHEDIYFDYIMSEVASIAVEYGICLQQTKVAKERYLTKLKLFDKQVAKKAKKKAKKKVVKITPYSEFSIEVKEDLTDKEKELTMKCLEFTNEEYSDYLKLRKKSNYLKGKLLKCVSNNFEFE